MKKERLYRACYDTGNGYGDFEYYSYYRNNSKKNLEDAYNEYRRTTGHFDIKIIQTYLLED